MITFIYKFNFIIIFFYFKYFISIIFNGDWGLGIGDWGLGIGDLAQYPKTKTQKPKTKTQINNKKIN